MRKRFFSPTAIGGYGAIIVTLALFFGQGGFGKMTPLTYLYIVGLIIGIGMIIYSVVKRTKTHPLQSPKPTLFILSSGHSWMAKEHNVGYQRSLFWYNVTISNPSLNITLGIKRITLTWENIKDDLRQVDALIPIVGEIIIKEDEREQPIKRGDIAGAFSLKPNKVKSGMLVFIGEENRFLVMGDFLDAIIIITDSQDNKYRYPARVNDILS